MTIYYSPRNKGFYDTNFGYPSLPEDIIEITIEEHRQLLNALNMENKEIYIEDGIIKTRTIVYVPTWDEIRSIRNKLLGDSDYTQVPDWPGDSAAWAAYRQQLRDLPQTYAAAEDVVWPTKPGG